MRDFIRLGTIGKTINQSLVFQKALMKNFSLSRREFLKVAAVGAGAAMLPGKLLGAQPGSLLSAPARQKSLQSLLLQDFPNARRLGRVLVGKTEVKARPDNNSATVADLYENAVVPGSGR
jgi:hypothetical protein